MLKRCALLFILVGCASGKSVSPTANVPVEVKGRRIDVKVTKVGYEPAMVPVKANEQVTLVFTRAEHAECGREITIPDLGLKKELPVGQPIAIELKPEKTGDITFACGMNMMHGQIVVTN